MSGMGSGGGKGAVLILGASSDMARAIAHAFGKRGYDLQLAARSPGALEDDRADLETRYGISVTLHAVDALDLDSHAGFVSGLPDLPVIAVSAIGAMGTQEENIADPVVGAQVMRANYEGPASLFAHLANAMEARGSGTLIGISSVAGLRGRASNYVYGSAKAGFTAYISGLRNRLATRGVHVMTVLPGFVATRMTEGMDLPARLTAAPEEVAEAILSGLAKGRNVIYVRRIWWLILAIIRAIPEPIFKKTSI